jgi:hypothetical protein
LLLPPADGPAMKPSCWTLAHATLPDGRENFVWPEFVAGR